MKTLSNETAARVRGAIKAKGRPLEAARLAYLEQPSPQTRSAVRTALSAFQNRDGGFGHGLEPDLATPASTAIATTTALQIMAAVDLAPDDPMVRAAVGYLESTVLTGALDGRWAIVGPEVEAAPHAPWWTWPGGVTSLAEMWNDFAFNPSAECLAHLLRFSGDAGVIARAEKAVLSALEAEAPFGLAYDLYCALRLQAAPGLSEALRERLEGRLKAAVPALDPSDQHTDMLALCPHPESFLMDDLAPQVAARLDAAIEDAGPDGLWHPGWSWDFVDAQAWAEAEAAWTGILSLQTYAALKAHGRVDA